MDILDDRKVFSKVNYSFQEASAWDSEQRVRNLIEMLQPHTNTHKGWRWL